MATVSLFWDTNMAAVTSCENTLYNDHNDQNDHFHIVTLFTPKILHNHCFQFLLGITVIPREIEGNGYANCCGGKQGALWSM